MDRRITIRFYEVETSAGGSPLETTLTRVAALTDKRDRRAEIDGVHVRLEHLEQRGGFHVGDLTRIQNENLPGQLTDLDVDSLPFAELGHGLAFSFDPQLQVLALQYEQKAQVRRVLDYFSRMSDRQTTYAAFPVIDAAQVNDLVGRNIKKLRFKVSGMQDFENSDVQQGDFERRLTDMAELVGAPMIEVTVSAKTRREPLDSNAVMRVLRRMVERVRGGEESVKTVKVEAYDEDDPFNFISQLLRTADTLDLPANDPPTARNRRIEFLYAQHDQRRTVIRQAVDRG